MPARDLFLLASSRGKKQTLRLHRLEGHARHASPRRPRAALQAAGLRRRGLRLRRGQGGQVVEEMRAAGYPIVEFAWSRKERDSVVTKLLAKKATIAADVFDKLRFRLITRYLDDSWRRSSSAHPSADSVQLRRPGRVRERHPALPPVRRQRARYAASPHSCRSTSAPTRPRSDARQRVLGAGLQGHQLRRRPAGPHRRVPVRAATPPPRSPATATSAPSSSSSPSSRSWTPKRRSRTRPARTATQLQGAPARARQGPPLRGRGAARPDPLFVTQQATPPTDDEAED